MLRQIRASRLKTFALVAALCGVILPVASTLLWRRWHLDVMSRNLGLDAGPLVFGLLVALVPVYFAAVEIWLPIRLLPRLEKPEKRRPLTDAQVHWNAVRLVALGCILVIELIAQSVPDHRAAHAATMSAR